MTEIILPTTTLPELIPWAAALVGVIWIIYSIVMTLHWVQYSYNQIITLASLAVYYVGSFAIIGFMVSVI